MRIIGGKDRGRKLKTLPGNHTRPTSDKIRGAIFNSLFDVRDAKVLDLFGGSGAMSLEALSRGANSAVIVESVKDAMTVIQENVEELRCLDKVELRLCSFHQGCKKTDCFDLVFLDPPYGKGFIRESVDIMFSHHCLMNGAIVVVETTVDKPEIICHSQLQLCREKNYGITKILFYKFDEE